MIDGGSTDGTVDVIREYEDRIDYWVSEPDGGIYYAMNKGIELATGRWINFMNSGDRFYDEHVVGKVFKRVKEVDCDLIYGEWVDDFGDFQRLREPFSLCRLWKGMCFSHNSSFAKSKVLKGMKFDTSYVIAADFDLIFKMFTLGFRFCHISCIICVSSMGGLSYISFVKSLWERRHAVKKYRNSLVIDIFYILLIFDKLFKRLIQKIIPRRITIFLLKNKYKPFYRFKDFGDG